MSCVEILKHLEENINVLQKTEYLLKWGGELSYQELMMDIGIDAFRGYEYFLTILLLAANDPAIERTKDRLFLQWFRGEIEANGASQTIHRIVQIMKEEHCQLVAQQNLAQQAR